jgi:hypothetical protein
VCIPEHGSSSAQRVASWSSLFHGELLAELFGAADQKSLDLIAGLGGGLDRAVARHCQRAQRIHGALAVLRNCVCLSGQHCAGGGFGVDGVVLAAASAVGPVGTVDLQHGHAGEL